MFQNGGAKKLAGRSVLASVFLPSLFLHCAAVLLLCLVGTAVSPNLRLSRDVVLIAPSLETPLRSPKSRNRILLPPRRFEAPGRSIPVPDSLRMPLPEPLPEFTTANKLDVPLILKAPETPAPEFPMPKISTPKIEVKASGFEAVERTVASLSQPRPFHVGNFESASGESVNRRGTVSQGSGFATETAVPPVLARPATRSGGFGDASVANSSAPKASTLRSTPATISAEILEKPRPLYTEEARRLGIEGEVLLEVVFEASGETAVVRIVRGLGHGLDQAAIAAACNIRFRPAQRDGVPVDSSAVVHIVFQLAY